MDRALVERLTCPMSHAVTPLVVRADALTDTHLTRGLVGCPECTREWTVADAIAQFGPRNAAPPSSAPDTDTTAALLGLAEPGFVIVDGAPATLVRALRDRFAANVIVFDHDDTGGVLDPEEPAVSLIDGAPVAPLAESTARAALLLRSRDDAFVASVLRTLTPGARVVAAAGLPVPGAVSVLARDAAVWVGERTTMPSAPVTISSRTSRR